MYAARGVAKSVIEEYPNTNISIHIIWAAMLGSDNELAARQSSRLFNDPRVHQYWDPQLRSGKSYSREVFPSVFKDMYSSLPEDSPFKDRLKDRVDTPAERMPMWDAAFFYPAGTKWTAKPPQPKTWIKQFIFYGEEEADGNTGQFWKDDYKKPPFDTDWFVELSKGMKKMTGKNPTTSNKIAGGKSSDIIIPVQKCGTTSAKPASVNNSTAEITSLADSLNPLQDHFNANKHRVRFVTLLSPT